MSKIHYAKEFCIPSYDTRSVSGSPALQLIRAAICGSRIKDLTTKKEAVTCKACLKKLGG